MYILAKCKKKLGLQKKDIIESLWDDILLKGNENRISQSIFTTHTFCCLLKMLDLFAIHICMYMLYPHASYSHIQLTDNEESDFQAF